MPDSITLYRFLGHESALKTIEGRKFRVGRLKEFNDPFEWRIGLIGYVPEGEAIAQSCMNKYIDRMNSKIGIICFSDTFEDPVLWAHYADIHSGAALEVEYAKSEDTLMKVKYSEGRPTFDVNGLRNLEVNRDKLAALVEQMLYQKALGWSYEKEYRVHIELIDCETGGGHYFKPIPDNFLKRVILGFRCPLEEAYIRKVLDKVGLGETEIVRASMDQTSYKITY